MYNIVVIDDEAIIRNGLIGYIDWKSLNCKVVADFSNGTEAIEYLKTSTVDIILSDIRMPGADGLEVAKYAYYNAPLSKVILYTGYSDFEYAKAAIKYDVADFIIKPSTMENIVQIIQQTLKKIELQRQKDTHITTLESKLIDVRNNEKLSLIKKIVEGVKLDPITLYETLANHHVSIHNYCLLLYKITGITPATHPQTIQFMHLSLSELNHYTFALNETTFGSLVAFDQDYDDDPLNVLTSKCHDINDFVIQYLNQQIYIGISGIHTDLATAPEAFMEAQRCLDNSFYSDNHLTLFSTFDGPKERPSFIELNLDLISQYLCKDKEDLAKATIVEMFNTMSQNKEPVDYIRSMAIAIYTICMNVVQRNHLKSDDIFIEENPYQQILGADTIDVLIQVLCNMIQLIIEYLSEGNNNYLIRKVYDYINKHYQEPIKLNDIAESIHINSSYLSRLFKEKTGQTITQTLRDLRVEKAKLLLKTDDIKTYTIAQLVGFEDPAYFSYVFKQQTGYSPSQYKNSNY